MSSSSVSSSVACADTVAIAHDGYPLIALLLDFCGSYREYCNLLQTLFAACAFANR